MVPPRPVGKSEGVRQQYSENTYRNALPDLLRDFQDRCAYSLIHSRETGPHSQMHVDHFDPTLVHPERNEYSNLNPAHAHCNQKKGPFWPSADQMASGKRFLNPCIEPDYGEHIFEDPQTHELVATSPAGRLQIDVLDLNNPFFVEKRADRSELLELGPYYRFEGPENLRDRAESLFARRYSIAIPYIPPPPGERELI